MEKLDFGTAFKYPFNRWQRLFNILWGLIPIIGWFAIIGYQIRLVKEWTEGKFEELPKFEFVENMKLGFFMFVKFIPFMLALMAVGWVFGRLGDIGSLVFTVAVILTAPMLVINFYREETIASLFDFDQARPVFDNLGEYIIALVMEIVFSFIFLIMSIILVGIPASAFTQNIFLSDFYRKYVK